MGHARVDEFGIVLAGGPARLEGGFQRHASGAQRGFQRGGGAGGQRVIIDHAGRAFKAGDLWRGGVRHVGHGLGGGGNALDQHLAHFWFKRAQGELQHGIVGDDVGHRARVKAAHGDHAEFLRVFLAADDGLHILDKAGAHHDGVDALVGHGAMRALADEGDADRIGGGGDHALLYANLACGRGANMGGKGIVGFGKAGEQAIGQHRLGPGAHFLRRLADEHQRAVPLVLQRDQRLRRAQPPGHMHIMAAGLHGEGGLAIHHLLRGAGPGQAGLFLHGQRVEFRAHQHHRAGAVVIDAHDAGFAHMLGHRKAKFAQLVRQQGAGAHFLKADLGMAVQILVERLQLGPVVIDHGVDFGPRGGGGQRGGNGGRGDQGGGEQQGGQAHGGETP